MFRRFWSGTLRLVRLYCDPIFNTPCSVSSWPNLAAAGIATMAAANHYLETVYRPAFNAEFAQPAHEEGSAFVPWIGGSLDEVLCEQHERTVSADNCVRFDGMILQIPADRHRCHYVKAKVRVHRYANGALALFHGPRGLAYFTPDGKPITQDSAEEVDNSCATEPDSSKNP